MNNKSFITRLGAAALMLSATVSYAQDIHFSQFDMQPLVVNPAFTGMFYGQWRANTIYRNQWKSVTVPYVTIGASADLPIMTDHNGDYLAAGLQVFKDQAGDGNLSNFTGMASLAYHKTFSGSYDDYTGSDLAVGLQAGYVQRSIDLSKLYFGDEFHNGTFSSGTSQEWRNGMGNSINYFLVNAGLCYSKATSRNFSFTIGLAANNLNQPNDALLKKQNSDAGLDMRFVGELGMVINTSDRFSLRPVAFAQYQASATEIIAGNEFHYSLTNNGDVMSSTAVFLGGYMRTGDAVIVTGGFEYKNFRVGLGFDYNMSALNNVSNGNGGFEIALKYVSPYSLVRRRTIPCNRF